MPDTPQGREPTYSQAFLRNQDIEVQKNHLLRQNDDNLVEQMKGVDIEYIWRAFSDDPWMRNLMTNFWEYAHGATVLHSYPWDICVPIADTCNARCTFCTAWLEGQKMMSLEEFERFEPIFRYARKVGLAGHGEPLSNPNIDEFLLRLKDWLDPRALCYVITNGVYLTDRIDALIEGRLKSFAISLNAATEATHREVMGLREGAFSAILDSIRRLVEKRDQGLIHWISISLVVTRQNIHEIPAFIALGNELRVNNIQIKTLAGVGGVVPGLNYHTLPPYTHPDYAELKANAETALASSGVQCQVDVASWDTPVYPDQVWKEFRDNPPREYDRRDAMISNEVRNFWNSQQKFFTRSKGLHVGYIDDFDGHNPYGRHHRFACKAPYHFLYINDFSYSMVPCCYMNGTPGYEPTSYDGTGSFFDAWNSPAMVELRRRLKDGPLFNMCTKCPATY